MKPEFPIDSPVNLLRQRHWEHGGELLVDRENEEALVSAKDRQARTMIPSHGDSTDYPCTYFACGGYRMVLHAGL